MYDNIVSNLQLLKIRQLEFRYGLFVGTGYAPSKDYKIAAIVPVGVILDTYMEE